MDFRQRILAFYALLSSRFDLSFAFFSRCPRAIFVPLSRNFRFVLITYAYQAEPTRNPVKKWGEKSRPLARSWARQGKRPGTGETART